MQSLLIGYDLNRSGKNYDDLIAHIKESYPTYWHHLDSTWIVRTESSCKQVRDALRPYLDGDDELLVVKLSGEGAWAGFSVRARKWLMDHL